MPCPQGLTSACLLCAEFDIPIPTESAKGADLAVRADGPPDRGPYHRESLSALTTFTLNVPHMKIHKLVAQVFKGKIPTGCSGSKGVYQAARHENPNPAPLPPQGFDEYMNLVLDEAEEVSMKRQTRKAVGEVACRKLQIPVLHTWG